MALGARQLAIYTDTFDIYTPTHTLGESTIGAIKYPLYELVETVPGKYAPVRNVSTLTPFGRMESSSKAELDQIYFSSDVVIHDQYCVKLTTPGHPLINTWWTVVGEPEIRTLTGARNARYVHVNVRGRATPPGIRSPVIL